ncbi:MAG: hypothetical protein Q9N68_06065 [Gammaproteobacteria bacterium]|nr:hypothetical protein [Gammaproteobacteria bacterium]
MSSRGVRGHLWLALLVAVLLVWWINPQVEIEGFHQEQVTAQLKEELTPARLQQRVEQALLAEDLDLAQAYLNLTQDLKLPVAPKLQAAIAEQEGFFSSSYRNGKEFGKGFIFGEGDSNAALVGSISSDFTVMGDLRDLSIEVGHYLHDEEVDHLVASLSAISLALSAGTVLSLGSAAEVTLPSKMALSLLKFAKKSRRISASFLLSLKKWGAKVVKLEPIFKHNAAMKGADHLSPKAWSELGTVVKRSVKLEKVETLLQPMRTIQKNSGNMNNSLKVMRYADSVEDLPRLSKLTQAFGDRSVAVLKIVGKGALKTSKWALKMGLVFFAMLFSSLYFSMSLIFSYALKKSLIG